MEFCETPACFWGPAHNSDRGPHDLEEIWEFLKIEGPGNPSEYVGRLMGRVILGIPDFSLHTS